MSIVSVNETFRNRAPVETLEGRTYIRTFDVITSVSTDGGYEIFSHASIPNPGSKHNKDTQAICQSVAPKLREESEDGCLWSVSCEYNTFNKLDDSGTDQDVDPVQMPPDISYGYTQYTRTMDKAYVDTIVAGGEPTETVLNSAKQPFDPPVVIERSNRVVRIVRNENRGDYNPEELDGYCNTINLKKINIGGIIFDVGQGRIRNIPAELHYKKNGNIYYRVTYEVEKDKNTHIKKLLDRGFYALNLTTGVYTSIKDDDGDIVTEPVLLDGAGQKAANPATATPYFHNKRFFEYKDWYPLKLPIDDGKRQNASDGGLL